MPDRHSTTLDPHSPAGPQPSAAAPSPLAPQASPRSSTHLTSAPPASARRPCPWLDAAIFLIIWLPAAAMALYVKWYTMTALGGFEKARRSSGYLVLGFSKHLSVFDGEIFLGLLLIPAILVLANRYLGRWFAAIVTPLVTMLCILVFATQLYALQETGRFISLHLIVMGINFGLTEPGAINYLSWRGIALIAVGFCAIVAATIWCFRRRGHLYSPKTLRAMRIAGELYVLAIALVLAAGWPSREFRTPYHESTFTRAFTSLWREKAVDTGEFADFNLDRFSQVNVGKLDSLSDTDLIARYRTLVHAPTPYDDPKYFGKEQGDNVLFFVFETLPYEFLPADDDLSQFPNLKRLRERSFVAENHYTTFPFTQCALFSVFSSWYPLDTLHSLWGGAPNQVAPDFLARLNAAAYESKSFSPLPVVNNTDEGLYSMLDFSANAHLNPADPLPPVPGAAQETAWQTHRIAADLSTLNKLKADLNAWSAGQKKFVAAFLPQVGHFPYTEKWEEHSQQEIRDRGRKILAMQDAWLGEVMDLLAQKDQLDHTIIVVFGDHGRRNAKENPDLRRGTIDETAFHVPLFIYAPHALDHPEHINWLTSHIDIAPTVLDLLGVQRDTQTEQGVAMWNRDLPNRTTFFFSQPLFGADGYFSNGNFFMLHYYSDMVYQNSRAVFNDSTYVMRGSPADRDVRSNLQQIVSLASTWQSRFALSPSPTH